MTQAAAGASFTGGLQPEAKVNSVLLLAKLLILTATEPVFVNVTGSVALLFKTHPHPDEWLAQLGEAMGERFDVIKGARNLPERLHPLK